VNVSSPPLFSIVIPMHNRARFIGRALASCLAQDVSDFEIVVVDDGSTDASPEVVKKVDDPRIRLICHETNRGRCPSRNTGMEAARGKWLVFLDSDDELLPDALRLIRERALELENDVGVMRFMCRDEAGQISPEPPHRDEVLDYEGYVRWMELTAHGREEAMPCARRSTFPHVRYPESHAEEAMYHLDMARAYRVRTCPEVVRLYHQDAANRVVRPTSEQMLKHAPDGARNVDAVLMQHGGALRRWAPSVFARMLQSGMLLHFLAGSRRAALGYAAQRLRLRPVVARTFVVLLVGLLGPQPLAWLRARWLRRSRPLTSFPLDAST
jgi:hypothetical protein